MSSERASSRGGGAREALRSGPRCMRGVDGSHPKWVSVFEQLDRVLDVPCPVLLSGPHGVGKQKAARALHESGCGQGGPFVVVDCLGAEPPHAAELDERGCQDEGPEGAHVSAPRKRFGTTSAAEHWVAAARGGTLYIEEITRLPAHAQVTLATLLREDAEPFRLVCASRLPASRLLGDGRLREDFFYRASVVSCGLPTLAERGSDIVELALLFLREATRRHRDVTDIAPTARRLLSSYAWPGNVSELRSVVEHAAAVCSGTKIEPADLPVRLRELGNLDFEPRHDLETQLPEDGLDLRSTLEALENRLLLQALDRTGWNKQRAAALLGLNRTTLVEMLKRKRLVRPTVEPKLAS